jgi:hypothetical protein
MGIPLHNDDCTCKQCSTEEILHITEKINEAGDETIEALESQVKHLKSIVESYKKMLNIAVSLMELHGMKVPDALKEYE